MNNEYYDIFFDDKRCINVLICKFLLVYVFLIIFKKYAYVLFWEKTDLNLKTMKQFYINYIIVVKILNLNDVLLKFNTSR